MKKTTIAISGPPGVGSSSLGKEIAKEMKLNFFSVGDVFKTQIKAKNQTEAALRVLKSKKGKSKNFHQELDKLQREIAKKGNVVIASKLAIFMLKDLASIKIWLKAPLKIRAKRVSKRDRISLEEAKEKIIEREKIERSLFKKIYGFDYFKQEKFADIVFENKYELKKAKEKLLKLVKKRIRKL